jgi:hypothetical protein
MDKKVSETKKMKKKISVLIQWRLLMSSRRQEIFMRGKKASTESDGPLFWSENLA